MAINFIKNLSQLITGGIGIVDDELVYKDSEGNVKTAGGEFETVAEIPESLDPGQIVFVEETASPWRGLKEGETGLDAGTPWPLKGYKLDVVNVSGLGSTPFSYEVRRQESDIDWNNVGLEVRGSAGFYDIAPYGAAPGSFEFTSLIESHGVAYDAPNGTFGPASIGLPPNGTDTIRAVLDVNDFEDEAFIELGLWIRIYPPN